MLTVSHICVWVRDQDEARDFYIDKLGFELRQDTDVAGFRWLTVSPPDQPELELSVGNPSSSVEPSPRTDQPRIRRPPLDPVRRSRTVPTRQSSPSTRKPASRHAAGSAATVS